MTVYQWLCLLGVPALIAGGFKYLYSSLKKNTADTEAVKIGIQALLRSQMIADYNKWTDRGYDQACVHAFIDANTGDVHQTLPWNRRGWHCASGKKGSGNNTHIGVEMCEPACIKYTGGATFTCSDPATAKAAVTRTYNAAVELFAMLCKQFGLDPLKDGVILSHKEGCARGIASNHGDPEHLWNQLGTGYTMNGFRAAVKAAMGAGGATTPGTPAKPTTAPETGKLTPYKVRITATDLNIRAGAGTNHPSKGYIPGLWGRQGKRWRSAGRNLNTY